MAESSVQRWKRQKLAPVKRGPKEAPKYEANVWGAMSRAGVVVVNVETPDELGDYYSYDLMMKVRRLEATDYPIKRYFSYRNPTVDGNVAYLSPLQKGKEMRFERKVFIMDSESVLPAEVKRCCQFVMEEHRKTCNKYGPKAGLSINYDRSNWTTGLKPLNYYLLDHDVVEVIQMAYGMTEPDSEWAFDVGLASLDYFGEPFPFIAEQKLGYGSDKHLKKIQESLGRGSSKCDKKREQN